MFISPTIRRILQEKRKNEMLTAFGVVMEF